MKVYFFSGLGADERAFINIKLDSCHEAIHAPWIIPEKNETLKSYAHRISTLIDSTKPFALVGLSFGGMIVSELMDILKPAKNILISSMACRKEIPLYVRTASVLHLYKFSSPFISLKANTFLYWIFGLHDPKHKTLFNSVLEQSNPIFSRWAVEKLMKWNRKLLQKNIVRIHGNKDRLLPINNFAPQYIIKDGGHLMILNKADEISDIISKELGID